MNIAGLIHNVIITKDNGTVVLSRYWDGSTPAQRGKFEHDLYHQTLPEWGEIMQYSKDKPLGQEQYSSHVALVDEKYVVFRKVNDLVFFITGSGFYTELVLATVLSAVINAMEVAALKKLDIAHLNDNTYGKMMASLDQVIYMGQYCLADPTLADSRAKMKAIQ